MTKTLLTAVAATVLLSASAAFAADVTTTTTWSDDQGTVFREYSTTKHYTPVSDPKIEVSVGAELPQNVTLYSLPDTVRVPERDRYSYVIVNEHPVVVEKRTRRIVHTW